MRKPKFLTQSSWGRRVVVCYLIFFILFFLVMRIAKGMRGNERL
jgi:hypothetical protein